MLLNTSDAGGHYVWLSNHVHAARTQHGAEVHKGMQLQSGRWGGYGTPHVEGLCCVGGSCSRCRWAQGLVADGAGAWRGLPHSG
eukprot:675674-Prorocentrum_lima.AAC.1